LLWRRGVDGSGIKERIEGSAMEKALQNGIDVTGIAKIDEP
jgi:hypothetical protein